MSAEVPLQTKLMAGGSLVTCLTTIGVVYKASQVSGGGFKFSSTSAITIAEFIKLIMSIVCTVMEFGGFRAAWSNIRAQLSLSAILHIWLLSALYTFNNQLSFFNYTLVDPGTVFLFKSASTLIVAFIQVLFFGKRFSMDQWRALTIHVCGMMVVQYDPCRSKAIHRPFAYCSLVLGACITGVCAARNEYLVKNYKITLNIQNMVLYSTGASMNLAAFFFVPNPSSIQANIGFFDGYDTPAAIMVVVANGLVGLAINYVYKYMDAIAKCIASDITAVLLCIISSVCFGLESTVLTWCGIAIVVLAVHLYANAANSGQPVTKGAALNTVAPAKKKA